MTTNKPVNGNTLKILNFIYFSSTAFFLFYLKYDQILYLYKNFEVLKHSDWHKKFN